MVVPLSSPPAEKTTAAKIRPGILAPRCARWRNSHARQLRSLAALRAAAIFLGCDTGGNVAPILL